MEFIETHLWYWIGGIVAIILFTFYPLIAVHLGYEEPFRKRFTTAIESPGFTMVRNLIVGATFWILFGLTAISIVIKILRYSVH